MLREPQVKSSKNLGYLKRHGLVESERCANLVIFRRPTKRSHQLVANLACLQDCVAPEPGFPGDLSRLAKLRAAFGPDCPACVREPDTRCAT